MVYLYFAVLLIGFLSFLIYIITLHFGIVYLIRMKRNRDCYIPLKKDGCISPCLLFCRG